MVAILALAILLVFPSPVGHAVVSPPDLHPPVPATEYRPAPDVSAASWIVFDALDGVVLGSRNADEIRPMASTTKMMTALIAFEQAEPGQTVTVSGRAADVGEAEIGLIEGEVLPIDDLTVSMVVRSANDAAIAVAEAIGGDVDTFVDLMNLRAVELGLTRTVFVNPHGLDAEGHTSTARDLLRLGLAAMANPRFREAASLRQVSIPPAPDGTPRTASTTNELLDTYEGAIGVKTGFTFQAGLVLVAAAERDGRTVYAVVMGSEGAGAHFADARTLLDYGFAGHRLVRAVTGQTAVGAGSIAKVAAIETQFHIAALLSESRAPAVVPVTAAADPTSLPGFGDALSWLFARGSDD